MVSACGNRPNTKKGQAEESAQEELFRKHLLAMQDSTIAVSVKGLTLGAPCSVVLSQLQSLYESGEAERDYDYIDYFDEICNCTHVIPQRNISKFTSTIVVKDKTDNYVKVPVRCILQFVNDCLYSIVLDPITGGLDNSKNVLDTIREMYISRYGVHYYNGYSETIEILEPSVYERFHIVDDHKRCSTYNQIWKFKNVDVTIADWKMESTEYTYDEYSFDQVYAIHGNESPERLAYYLMSKAKLLSRERQAINNSVAYIVYRDNYLHQIEVDRMRAQREKGDRTLQDIEQARKDSLIQAANKASFENQEL